MTALEITCKAIGGGLLVLAFAVIAQTLTPKRFAGILAAAPSVAIASLTVTVAFKGPEEARLACIGMLAGSIGLVVYSVLTPILLTRMGTLRGSSLALLAWAGGALAAWPAATVHPIAALAAPCPHRHRRRSAHVRPPLRCEPGKLREATSKDIATRFAFGAATSAAAGLISVVISPRVGGVFLAFPAIMLASLTLIADDEGRAAARDDARGAIAGAVGMACYALVGARLYAHITTILVFTLAALAWLVSASAVYFLAWLTGHGADEPAVTS